MFWTPRSCRYFFSVTNLCFSLLQRTISTNQLERDYMSIIKSKHRHVNFSAASQNVTENSHCQFCGRMHHVDEHCSGQRRSPTAMPQFAAWLHKRAEFDILSIFSLRLFECPSRGCVASLATAGRAGGLD
ncbi:hypothetical protein BDP81DRAFT_38264 [Colletotrichum phormii]|uniref:Uncharacterized protein n=1 Tax=Colletotrichum phormii TaxID=359342 RepID=A0AAI9ZR30_9PEZI|nr:uncharacterized protein BDP81DRAFT_38264 [Colletotrichum phormii]KAK1635448.1 hypothetical protein BDP81DRAFT_38264 [Colletotrichum phormii]